MLTVSERKGPIILVALIAHHTPNATSGNSTSYNDMGFYTNK